jgi:hypothetical protein
MSTEWRGELSAVLEGLFDSIEALCEGKSKRNLKKDRESRWGKFYRKLGIDDPEKAQPNHQVKSIGYSKKKKGYCGWSHRAYSCFPVGKEAPKDADLVPGFMGKLIKSLEQSKEAAKRFAREVS